MYTRLCSSLRFAAKSCSRIGFEHVPGAAANTGMEAIPSQKLGNLRMADGEAPPHYESAWPAECTSMMPKLKPTLMNFQGGPTFGRDRDALVDRPHFYMTFALLH